MRKSTLIAIVAIVFLLMVVIVGVHFSQKDSDTNIPGENTNSEDNNVNGKQTSFFEQTDTHVIDIKYPDTPDDDIDASIRAHIEPYITSFKEYQNSGLPDLPENTRKYALIAEYKVTSNNDYTTYVYTIINDTGGAHPNTNFETITFDKDGSEVSIEDILEKEFTETPVILDDLSTLTKEKLYEKLGREEGAQWIEDGASPDPDNYRSFSIGEDGLTIIFAPYQVGPYAWGVQNVKMTFDELFKSSIETKAINATSTDTGTSTDE